MSKELLLTPDEEDKLRIEWKKLNPETHISWRDYWLKAQLAKVLPLIEKQGFATGIAHYRKVILPTMMEEAKREERKRIIAWLEERVVCEHQHFYHRRRTCDGCWQALKGEANGKTN